MVLLLIPSNILMAFPGQSKFLHFVPPRKRTRVKRDLLVYYQNTRGLRTRLKNFPVSSACCHYDVLCIMESWLHSSISDGEIVDNTYRIFRKYRDSDTSNFVRGGGVFIAVKHNITAEPIAIINAGLEQVYIEIKGFGEDIILGCVYIPPQSHVDVLSSHLATITNIKNKYPNNRLLVIGDYNIYSSVPKLECESKLYEKFILAGCSQHNNVCNVNDRILDLCFSDLDIVVDDEDKYHSAILARLKFCTNLKRQDAPTYAFKSADYAALNNYFLRVNWIHLYTIDNTDEKVNWFYDTVNKGIAEFVPLN
ncbi:uncharacterized protein LOC130669047 [Microplitis mediator]|uniref:uncharacterized protein LOC130669047 n=1 Tax=Microplitis mediator TaxID=375433 RepID=UPI0025524DB6|nr:uncharacterized protein LOC130669047 [Microplitis mediator]XP_057327695.1 uncharacterized protein LOC130669047 [Microplitis mediator]